MQGRSSLPTSVCGRERHCSLQACRRSNSVRSSCKTGGEIRVRSHCQAGHAISPAAQLMWERAGTWSWMAAAPWSWPSCLSSVHGCFHNIYYCLNVQQFTNAKKAHWKSSCEHTIGKIKTRKDKGVERRKTSAWFHQHHKKASFKSSGNDKKSSSWCILSSWKNELC